MKILITGGTGFIGASLVEHFAMAGHQVIVVARGMSSPHGRRGRKGDGFLAPSVRMINSAESLDQNEQLDAVINLAGESISAKKWSKKQKAILMESRLVTTRRLVASLEKLKHKPKVFISASAIGYYGARGLEIIDERVNASYEFTSKLCAAWEYEARRAESTCRTVIMRLGLVLGRSVQTKKPGGLLARLILPAKFFVSARMGRGDFYMSWIHLRDIINAIDFFIEHKDCRGVYNLTAPNPLPQKEFARVFAQVLRKFELFFIPAFMIKWIFGEMGDRLLLHGQRVLPKKLLAQSFTFQFSDIEAALLDVLQSKRPVE
ncbi:MAG: TIGR01777 family oxidoreductase [Hydrotalea sp.]|nr:TIGR01777 family oxidoreductase [Hydrotalea sp.]